MKTIKIIAFITVLIVGIVGIAKWRSAPKKTCANTACSGDSYADMYVTNALFRAGMPVPRKVLNPPLSYYPTEAESNELAHAFMEIAEVYANGSLSALRERMADVPPIITNVARSVCIEVQRPLCTLFDDSFSIVRQVRVNGKVVSLKSNEREFFDVKEFDDFAKRNIETTLFLGETELKRGASSGYLVYLDKQVLRSFNAYREKFRSEGKTELAVRADEFYRQWCERVESENGFTRSYARFQLGLQMSGGKTKAQAAAFARSCVAGIVRCGYTPKWLDAEFPAVSDVRVEE